MKIYTKTGDRGETGLFGGTRVPKASLRVSAYGDIDELNSFLGVAAAALRVRGQASGTEASEQASGVQEEIRCLLQRIQSELFNLGAELASTPTKEVNVGVALISEAELEALEQAIDHYEQKLPPLKSFVLPGGDLAAAQLHLARTVCRRAERSLTALGAAETVREMPLRYINRLSDLLFVLARMTNHEAGVADVPWQGRQG